jgi:hypothetical protein
MLLFLEGITLRQTRSESYASVLDEINNPPRIWGAGEACTVALVLIPAALLLALVAAWVFWPRPARLGGTAELI